jgi:hypothetical protein
MLHRSNASKSRRRLSSAAILACLAAVLCLATSAQAARNLITGTADPAYRSTSDTERSAAFDTTIAEGGGIVRADVVWRGHVGDSRPANPTDPADPAYDFSTIDAAVRDASARGLDVILTVYSAPDWAEGPNRDPVNQYVSPAGSWNPDPGDLAAFATALATRYSGSYEPPSGGGALPEVDDFEAWNEENLPNYLSPQYRGKKLVSVEQYRQMLNAFYDAVHKANKHAKVLIGGNAPYGDPPGGNRSRPLTFLKDLFCLTNNLKPTSCPKPAKFDILGVHPINLSGGPARSAIDPNDASSADMPEVIKVLRTAEKNHTIKGGHHDVWATEFWWESRPDSGAKAIVSLEKHGIYIEQAMYLFWKAGIDVAINLQLTDDPATGDEQLNNTFQAGLYAADGTPKPAATSFRFPFVLDRTSNSKALVWGKSPEKGKLVIEEKKGSGWKQVKSVNVKDNRVFTSTLDSRGKGDFRATIGDQTSLVWSLGK